MNELPDDLKAVLRRGDPAQELPAQLEARVAARLNEGVRPRSWRPLALVALALASAALGSGLTLGVTRLTRTDPPPPPLPPSVVSPRPRALLPPDPLTRETELLQDALEALRQGDPTRALAKLDERERLGSGVLDAEARVARIRALLAKDDAGAALELLEGTRPVDVTAALRLVWVRTLVARGECARARQVAEAVPPESAEVARVTLESCVQGGGR